jgi:leishmanolysin-like peptidase
VKREPLQTECTDDRNSVALCNLVKHEEPLPREYQNFDTLKNVENDDVEYYGGSVSLADHCPYIQEFTWRSRNVVVRGSQCTFEENNPNQEKNFALENYGMKSKCFEHSDKMWEERSCHQTREWQHWGSGCYLYACKNGRLHLHVSNYTFECFHPGQVLNIRVLDSDWLHYGQIVCPSCEEMCASHFESHGEKCKKPQEAPSDLYYPKDHLKCRASVHLPSIVILVSLIKSYFL